MIQDFFIHFDLEDGKHELPISQSIVTEEALKNIVQEINKKVFDNKLTIEVIVYPSENGGFLKKFGISIISGIVAFPLTSDIANGIVMGLGDGRNISEYVRDGVKIFVQGFLEKDNNALVQSGITYDAFYKAYDAKNKFWYSALDNKNVKGIGFEKEYIFPTTRDYFAYRIVNLKEKTSGIDPIEKYHDLLVISSINTKEDRKLTWRVKDRNKKKRFELHMNDANFYEKFLENPILLKSLICKVRYYLTRNDIGDIEVEKKEIITVYKYNDNEIFALPGDAKIEEAPWTIKQDIDETKYQQKQENKQQTLFDL